MARVVNKFLAPGINADKIADGSVSNTEFQYLANVTADIQTQLDSKLGYDVISIAVDTNALSGKTYLATVGGITVTLPSPALNSFLTIKDAGGNANSSAIIIDGDGANIDGAATYELTSNYESVTLVANGLAWYLI